MITSTDGFVIARQLYNDRGPLCIVFETCVSVPILLIANARQIINIASFCLVVLQNILRISAYFCITSNTVKTNAILIRIHDIAYVFIGSPIKEG